jgi:uncharacterized protein (TIGR03437 family)
VKRVSWISVFCFSVSAAMAQAPVISAGGVANGAAFGQSPVGVIAPGELISVFGTNLASSTAAADSVPLSTNLAGVTVSINGTLAPIHDVCHLCVGGVGDQLNIQMPWGITGSNAQVVVTKNNVGSAPSSVAISQTNPGIFTVSSGVGTAIAIFTDGALAAPAGSIPGLSTRAAKAGDALQIWGTGLGAVDSPIADGANSLDKLRNTLVKPTVLIGNTPAQVLFSGLTPFFGYVDQVNVVVATGTPSGNAIPVQWQIGSVTTSDKATIAVQ